MPGKVCIIRHKTPPGHGNFSVSGRGDFFAPDRLNSVRSDGYVVYEPSRDVETGVFRLVFV